MSLTSQKFTMSVLGEERLPNAYLRYSASTVSSSCEASLSDVVSSTSNCVGGARFLGRGTGWTGEFESEVSMCVVSMRVEGSPQRYLCICARYVGDTG